VTRKPNPKSKSGFSVKARDESEKQVISDLKQLAFQDDVEISDLVFEGLLAMFKVHHWPPGNPQLTMSNYMVKPLDLGVCGYSGCKRRAVGVGLYLPKQQEFKLCQRHFIVAGNSGKVWGCLKKYDVEET
jgi:hypothetical protein